MKQNKTKTINCLSNRENESKIRRDIISKYFRHFVNVYVKCKSKQYQHEYLEFGKHNI